MEEAKEKKDSNPSRPKIGLVLGGGGVRASFHIGFYDELCKNNIPIDYVTGTSMGAIVGGAIALGFPPKKMKEIMLGLGNMDLFTLKNFNYFSESLLKHTPVLKNLKDVYQDYQFKDCKIPFACLAVDLESGKEVVLNEGSLFKAISASSAYPVIFPPVFYKDKYLVDGGLLSNVPAMAARNMGADKVIAIAIRNNKVRQYISGQVFKRHYKTPVKESWFSRKFRFVKRKKQDLQLFVDILLECVAIASRRSQHMEITKAEPDVLVSELVDVDLFEFSRAEEAIKMGQDAAKKYMPQIKALLGEDFQTEQIPAQQPPQAEPPQQPPQTEEAQNPPQPEPAKQPPQAEEGNQPEDNK
ncbi:patatin-like phospholipase family protein [Patescibacteria group bacterium]